MTSKRITGKTKLIALLGNPVCQSVSPEIHNLAFEFHGLDYTYMAFRVEKNQLEKAVEGLRSLDATGFNVTMPYKELILSYLDEITEEARLCNAVNTVYNNNGKLIGHNTDGKGFLLSLEKHHMIAEGNKFVVLGAGGASRSIVMQLALEGAAEIVIFNRSKPAALNLMRCVKENFPRCHITCFEIDMDIIKLQCQDAIALINTTSIGMGEFIGQSIITDIDVFHSDLTVVDIIYAPAKTKLLQLAEASGCNILNGLGMIIGQGALAFKIWTGHEMPMQLINNYLIEKSD